MKSSDVSDQTIDIAVFHIAETTSTMVTARELAHKAPYGVVYADRQSAGRGRLPGRSWNCAPGEGLLATFWFPANFFKDCPPALVTGAIVLEALQQLIPPALTAALPITIKWPNDILAEGKKLAGILCENTGTTIFAGIGINLAQREFPGQYRTLPTSLLLSYNILVTQEIMLHALMHQFAEFPKHPESWFNAVNSKCAYKNEHILFKRGTDTGTSVIGFLRGIDRSGYLILETSKGTQVEASGEIYSTIDPKTIIE